LPRRQSLFHNLVASRPALRDTLAAMIYSPPTGGVKSLQDKMLRMKSTIYSPVYQVLGRNGE